MNTKLRTAAVNCQQRGRSVEITYQKLGPWYAPAQYHVVSCPAMNDTGFCCNRGCESTIDRAVVSYHNHKWQ